MSKILEKWLKFIAKKIIKKYQPRVIAVTGSYGKTSTKDAVYLALRGQINSLRKSEGNLNTSWGLPYTIIGSSDPGGSVVGWLRVILRGILQILFTNKKYPKNLIVEMGADKPGDIAYLLEIVRPHISVLTGIGATHLELFGSIEQVVKEKARLVGGLQDGGVAIYNYDDDQAGRIASKHGGRVLSFGFGVGADIQALQIRSELNDLAHEQSGNSVDDGGISFNVASSGGAFGTGYLRNTVGRAPLYAVLAALTVAKALGLDLSKVLQDVRSGFIPTPGRMRLLGGIKRTLLIDDTYNSSPQAVILALETLMSLEVSGKKIAVLGNMLELGNQTSELHTKVGERVAELEVDMLITVGERAIDIAHGAIKVGMSVEKTFEFADVGEAGKFLQEKMKQGDLILIKGSRGVGMEAIVKEVMAHPQRDKHLLVH